MLLTFWLENVLCATAACYIRRWNFQKWSEAGALYILTSMCVSRHSGMQFFHFSSGHTAPHPPLWRAFFATLPTHKSLENHDFSRLSYHLAHVDLLSLLCFSSLHSVGSLTSMHAVAWTAFSVQARAFFASPCMGQLDSTHWRFLHRHCICRVDKIESP